MEDAQYLSPEPGVRIPFRVRQALMTLVVRPPTAEELNSNMPFFELTSPDRWDPLSHNDNGSDVEPLDVLQAQLNDTDPTPNETNANPNAEGNTGTAEPLPLPVQNGRRAPALEFDPLDVPEGFLPAVPNPDAAPGQGNQAPAFMNDDGNENVAPHPEGNGEEHVNDVDLVFFDTSDDPSPPTIVTPTRTKAELDPGGYILIL